MSDIKTLTKEMIVDLVVQNCSHVHNQLKKHNLVDDKYISAASVVSRIIIGFNLGASDSSPLAYLRGSGSSDKFDASACQCPSIIRNEQGYLELEDPDAPYVNYSYSYFSYDDCYMGPRKFKRSKMTVYPTKVTYPPLPEKCEELPRPTKTDGGAKLVVSFIMDAENGELAFIYYEHWGYSSGPTSQWSWANPEYDANILVNKTEKEFGKYSIESARAYEQLYAQKCMSGDRIIAQMASEDISKIYREIYGDSSNSPFIVNAIKRDFGSITYGSYTYYCDYLDCYQRMLKVKEAHPEVDFPDVEELRKLIAKYEPLAEDERWERHIR